MKWIVVALLIWAAWTYLRPKAKRGTKAAPSYRMIADEAEARDVLGVPAGADADAIRAAHRRLLVSVHPDRGGSTDLARRVNAARDLLLKR